MVSQPPENTTPKALLALTVSLGEACSFPMFYLPETGTKEKLIFTLKMPANKTVVFL